MPIDISGTHDWEFHDFEWLVRHWIVWSWPETWDYKRELGTGRYECPIAPAVCPVAARVVNAEHAHPSDPTGDKRDRRLAC
jgi:hypothetical protein